MELDWTTLSLEVINFLVLIWLLTHFLYRPVLNVVAQRQARVQATLDTAEKIRADAAALQADYTQRMHNWQEETRQARQELQESLAQEKARQHAELATELARAADSSRQSLARQQEQWKRNVTEQAMQLGAGFAACLLTPLADAQLEGKLIALFCDWVPQWSDSKRQAFSHHYRTSLNGNGGNNGVTPQITITSRYAIEPALQARLQQVLAQLLEQPLNLVYEQHDRVIAGLCIAAGGWTLGLNLADELKGFAESYHD